MGTRDPRRDDSRGHLERPSLTSMELRFALGNGCRLVVVLEVAEEGVAGMPAGVRPWRLRRWGEYSRRMTKACRTALPSWATAAEVGVVAGPLAGEDGVQGGWWKSAPLASMP